MSSTIEIHPSSFRDPSGFVFQYDGAWYRAVQEAYKHTYEDVQKCGLYSTLQQKGWMIAHEEVVLKVSIDQNYKILKPEPIGFQSYPYEWCFGQLKAAAILTLDICVEAMKHGFILKDATAYNIFFKGTQPCHLDTLSLARYDERKGWTAFQQFLRHFVNPLLLMKKAPAVKPFMLSAYPDGLEGSALLQMASGLSKLSLPNWLYVFLPARINTTQEKGKRLIVTPEKCVQMLQHLRGFIAVMQAPKTYTIWDHYYQDTIISPEYLQAKKELIASILQKYKWNTIVDLGANTGEMSLLAANYAEQILCCDYDHWCIHKCFEDVRQSGLKKIYPFIADLMQPAPALGWGHEEHASFMQRCKGDLVMALALIHHLRIAHNVPWKKIMTLLYNISPQNALVEFVPKEDEKVQQLLANREDIFQDYHETDFLQNALQLYQHYEEFSIPHSNRKLYLFQNH